MESVLLMGPTSTQAFWLWFVFAIFMLGIETIMGTQWLLWSAVAAGLVSVICLTGLPFGFVFQCLTFALLSVAMAILTPRFMKVGNHADDINDPHLRMVGKQAEVLSGFEFVAGGERTGRVLFDGVEWPAVWSDAPDTKLGRKDRVTIEKVHEGRMFVKLAV